jgi:RNA polymerase sigma-70 factor (ECF subfamily)
LENSGKGEWVAAVMHYRAIAVNICRGLLEDIDAAEDVVQLVITAMIRKLSSGDLTFSSREHIRNYFLKAVRNRTMDILKDRRRQLAESDGVLSSIESGEEDPLQSLLGREENERKQRMLDSVSGGIEKLRSTEREVIMYRFVKRMKYREISELTGIPITTLKSREDSALRKLRKIVVNAEPAP